MAEYSIRIYKDADDWKVDSPVDSGGEAAPNRLRAGDRLKFYLVDESGKVHAHLQFTHPRHRLCNPSTCFLKNVGNPESGLDKHWRVKDIHPGQDRGVTLELCDFVAPGEYHYAVFITPDGKFAFGSNPPPKIDVGGG